MSDRRSQRDRRAPSRRSSKEAPLTVPGLAAWFDSRYDSYLTLSGSNVSAWVSRAGSLGPISLQQATSTYQPIRVQNVASVQNKSVILFDGVDDFLQLPSAQKGLFSFLHNGNGCTIFAVWSCYSAGGSVQTLLDTAQGVSQVGALIQYDEATPSIGIRVYDGDGSNVTIARNASGIVAQQDVTRWMAISLDTNATTYALGGYSDGPAGAISSPSAADPFAGLIIGSTQTATTSPLKGHVCQLLFFDRILTSAERQILAEWASREYGWAVLSGVTGFSNTGSDYLTTTGGITGTASGFWVAGLVKVDSQSVPSQTSYIARSLGTGWFLRCGGTNSNFSFLCYDGSGSTVSNTAYNVTSADVGKVKLVVGVHDGTTLRMYVDGAEVGSGTAITGYTVPTATTLIGHSLDGVTIFGVAGGHGVPSLAQVQAYGTAIKAAGRMVTMTGVQTDHVWNTTTAGTITDEIAGSSGNLTVTGSLSSVRQTAAWGF